MIHIRANLPVPSYDPIFLKTDQPDEHASGKTEDGSRQTSDEEKYLFHRFILSGAVPV